MAVSIEQAQVEADQLALEIQRGVTALSRSVTVPLHSQNKAKRVN